MLPDMWEPIIFNCFRARTPRNATCRNAWFHTHAVSSTLPISARLHPHDHLDSIKSPRKKGTFRFAYCDDISDVAAAWNRLQEAVDADAPGATEAFEAFKRERMAYVDYLQAVRSLWVCHLIVSDQLREWAISLEEEMGKRNEEMKKQYVAL